MDIAILILKLIVAAMQLLDAVLKYLEVIQGFKSHQKERATAPYIADACVAMICYVFMTLPDDACAMTLSVFCILLFAALLHCWNAIVKAGNDKLYAAISVSGSAAIMALLCLPFAPQPSTASIPFLAASTALQVVYTVLVARTYTVSDMSQTYPLMRGDGAAAGGNHQRSVSW